MSTWSHQRHLVWLFKLLVMVAADPKLLHTQEIRHHPDKEAGNQFTMCNLL